jgi:D-galactarolactone cycloisomerase
VRIWEEHYAFSRDFGQKGTYIEAISAIDIALWDIAGQAAGLPVWKMLGGRFRDSVTAYATGCYYPDSYSAVMKEIGTAHRHEVGGRLNNRAENSHQPFRRRERAMQMQDWPQNSPSRM